jgi:hypothetical protein
MVHTRVIVFIVLSVLFAATHAVAMQLSLYYWHWWFDIPMHFWGGGLIALGVHSFATFSRLHFKPTVWVVLGAFLLIATAWEVFEWFAGLYDPATYLVDVTKDVVVGLSGGLLAQWVLRRYTIS